MSIKTGVIIAIVGALLLAVWRYGENRYEAGANAVIVAQGKQTALEVDSLSVEYERVLKTKSLELETARRIAEILTAEKSEAARRATKIYIENGQCDHYGAEFMRMWDAIHETGPSHSAYK